VVRISQVSEFSFVLHSEGVKDPLKKEKRPFGDKQRKPGRTRGWGDAKRGFLPKTWHDSSQAPWLPWAGITGGRQKKKKCPTRQKKKLTTPWCPSQRSNASKRYRQTCGGQKDGQRNEGGGEERGSKMTRHAATGQDQSKGGGVKISFQVR